MNSPNDSNSRRRFLQTFGTVFASLAVPDAVWAFSNIRPIGDPIKGE